MSWGWGWRPYVPMAERRRQARRYIRKLEAKGRRVCPVELQGRTIARTFWGRAWCQNLESYSDFANRLPRGTRYVRNGSVIDLQIRQGRVEGIVSGSEIYHVRVDIKPVSKRAWGRIKKDCAGTIDSLMDLLQGRFADSVMQRLTRQDGGLFPKPAEISMECSCPDWAYLCKHIAAVLYGVGARLDTSPELLFLLRGVDHLELVQQASQAETLDAALSTAGAGGLEGEDLGELFGIDLEQDGRGKQQSAKRAKSKRRGQAAARRTRRTRPAASGDGTAATGKRVRAAKSAKKKPAKSRPAPRTQANRAGRKTTGRKKKTTRRRRTAATV